MANRMSGSFRENYPNRGQRDNKTRMPRGVARQMKVEKRREAIERQTVNIDRGYYYARDWVKHIPASLDKFSV